MYSVNLTDVLYVTGALALLTWIVYIVRQRFKHDPEGAHYCDYCGSKLIEDPIGSTPFNNIRFACPVHGYNCIKGE